MTSQFQFSFPVPSLGKYTIQNYKFFCERKIPSLLVSLLIEHPSYKTMIRPVIEYGSTIWSPVISDTNLKLLQSTQNNALRIATGCTLDTNVQHLHEEMKTLPLQPP